MESIPDEIPNNGINDAVRRRRSRRSMNEIDLSEIGRVYAHHGELRKKLAQARQL